MGFQAWRRFHGEFVAAVIDKGAGEYRFAVWHDSSGVGQQLPCAFNRRDAAKAAADDLLQRVFGHRCTIDLCGE